jgi:hypothetical protein
MLKTLNATVQNLGDQSPRICAPLPHKKQKRGRTSETVHVLEHAVTPNDTSSSKTKMAYHKKAGGLTVT